MLRSTTLACLAVLLCVRMEQTSSAKQEICQQKIYKDIDHPDPGGDCIISAEARETTNVEAYRRMPVEERDDADYHDSRIIAPRKDRIIGE